MFHSKDGLFFRRNKDNSVTIIKTNDGKEPVLMYTPEEGTNVVFEQTLDDGTWCSAVLTMTAFNERPGDWPLWMAHHKGENDLLVRR